MRLSEDQVDHGGRAVRVPDDVHVDEIPALRAKHLVRQPAALGKVREENARVGAGRRDDRGDELRRSTWIDRFPLLRPIQNRLTPSPVTGQRW